MHPEEQLRRLAERQHGFVHRDDARLAGLSPKVVRRLIASGEWEAHGPRLLRRTGAPMSKASRLVRGVLDLGPGAFVSQTTAVAWWGLPGFDLREVHVSRPRGISGSPPSFGQRLHEVLDLTTSQVTVLDGVPIVRPERAVFELFGSVPAGRAVRAAENAWSRGLLSGTSLTATFLELGGQGRAGTVATREFLEQRPPGWVPPASGIEARFADIARSALLGPFRRQVDLGDDRWVGRVDFLHDWLPMVVEVQSERYHAALLDRAHDAQRRARLESAGFTVVEVWDVEVWHQRDEVVRRVRAAERPLIAKLQSDRARNGHDLTATSVR